jgi:hypothetical protein
MYLGKAKIRGEEEEEKGMNNVVPVLAFLTFFNLL